MFAVLFGCLWVSFALVVLGCGCFDLVGVFVVISWVGLVLGGIWVLVGSWVFVC